MCILSIKVSIRKKSGNLSNDPRINNADYADDQKTPANTQRPCSSEFGEKWINVWQL